MVLPSTFNSQKFGTSMTVKYVHLFTTKLEVTKDVRVCVAYTLNYLHRLFHFYIKCTLAFDRKIGNGTNDL